MAIRFPAVPLVGNFSVDGRIFVGEAFVICQINSSCLLRTSPSVCRLLEKYELRHQGHKAKRFLFFVLGIRL